MNQKTLAGDRRRRKLVTALWALGLTVIVIVLIYLERSDVLYILCTLSVTVLLMIVAFARLEPPGEPTGQPVVQPSDRAKEA